MRVIKIIFNFILLLGVLSSCDENKSKTKEIAIQFAEAVNAHDKATVFELFAESKDMPNMTIVENVDVESIEVEYDDSLKEYIVSYGNDRKQSIEIYKDSANVFKIIDTYHIFNLDSVVYELALKTGVPVNDYSDIHLCDLMKEGSNFINQISSGNNFDDILKIESYSFDWERYESSPYLYVIINNKSKSALTGEDYKIELFLYHQFTNTNYLTLVADGKDINPGGRERIKVLCDGIEEVGDINNNTYIKYRFSRNKISFYEQLLKYGDWNGKEYELFVNVNKMIDQNEAELDEKIKLISKKKLSKDDLKNLLPIYVNLLRNSVYAKHGYIFGDETLADFFEGKTWYKGVTKDMVKVYNEFNDIEKYNVNLIKEFESDK